MDTTEILTKHNQGIPKTPGAFIGFFIRPHRLSFWSAITLVVIAALLHQVTPFLFKLIIDAIEANRYDLIAWYAGMYPLLFLLIQVAYRVGGLFAAKVVIAGKKEVTIKLFSHVLQHSRAYFADHFSGAVQGKINTITTSSENFIDYAIWSYADAIVSFASILIVIAFFNTQAAVIFALLIVSVVCINLFLTPKKERLSVLTAAASTAQSGEMVDVFTNSDAVRHYSKYDYENNGLVRAATKLYTAEYKSYLYGQLILILNVSIIVGAYGIIMWILVGELSVGALSTGNFVFILGLLAQIAYQLLYLGNSFQAGAQDFGQIKEGLAALLVPFEVVDTPGASRLAVSAGTIEWTQVKFLYGAVPVFKDFNLVIPPGQRVGVVGTSGAGKSTFVSLLLRQNDINAGSITIDGQDISKVTQYSLRTAIAVVPQEPILFHRSIRENIGYGKEAATLEEISNVAKQAEAHDFIMSLPEGYDTLVGERGVKLSGGQKQRIAIARAMLKDAPILVLDEATSALDSESEVAIQKALHELMVGKTVIAIAHRLSTLREMDRIIVLENGQIIEDGTHETLKGAGGKYETLWNHQAGGFVGG